MIFSNICEHHFICWLVYIKCRHFLPQGGEPILPQLLRFSPFVARSKATWQSHVSAEAL
jgi:hypothetical protein